METFTSKIEFIKKCFGNVNIARDGINVATRCPSCKSNKKKKFSIDTETWRCHCWVCGIKGRNPHGIIKKYSSRDLAIEFNTRFLGNRLNNHEESKEESLSLPKNFIPLCSNINSRDPDIKDCLAYLFKRGLTKRDLWYFKLGSVKSGALRRRVIIPSFDFEGVLNYYAARSIDDSFLKYINSKSKKSEIIFNEINIDWNSELTIVEGPFDMFRCNFNTTCLLGSSLSLDSYLFKRIASNKTPILLCLDADMKTKSAKIADILISYGCNVRILDMSGFSDVGEMSRHEFILKSKAASYWNLNDSLKSKISNLRSGSLF